MISIVETGTVPLADVGAGVLAGNIAILKQAVDSDFVIGTRRAVHARSMSAPESKLHPKKTGGACHLASYLPPKSKSRYIFHSFEFDPASSLPIVASVMPLFEAMRRIYCGLVGKEIAFRETH
jgi:hypothetical protein